MPASARSCCLPLCGRYLQKKMKQAAPVLHPYSEHSIFVRIMDRMQAAKAEKNLK